ncbi:GNAT family N-acetyltransferase [Chengkuizengella axinellae]|uniref:GNAT family N-acetyltransferase n=1 Tax=Chengkuizengella axinellae TaxID=3064388 RepID=A0ABT9ITL9_9BACL|nr:GNAT family N-acetyltransferase [Chengkuizengella sp. 2205SS18-9]MDP5272632.1 GNAT family N-acetyltransferase [Chengkuizengella sp. 2205SS18-9]
MITLSKVTFDDYNHYLDLLVLADESEEIVKSYLYEGHLFAAIDLSGNCVGVSLIIEDGTETIEIKNMAVTPSQQGKGYGKEMIKLICELYKQKGFKVITVGTANSSINNLAFYQKCGFRITHVRRNFFANYPEEIWEDGIRALDMVMLNKYLVIK